MRSYVYKPQEVIMGSIQRGENLLESLTRVCIDHQVKAGAISLIGAVSTVSLAYYDQDKKSYTLINFINSASGAKEIVSATGNVSLKDNEPFVHMHIVLSDSEGVCEGGHLMPGTTVYACEYKIVKLTGPSLDRAYDKETGLYLWK